MAQRRGQPARKIPTPPPPALPATVRVNDAELAEAARAKLEPLGVTVEHVEQLPTFDAEFEALAEFLRAAEEEPESFSWEIDPALARPLFEAAADLWRRAPWDDLPDHPPLAIALGEHGPQPGVETIYGSVIGGAGMVFGLCLYYTLDDLWAAMRGGVEVEGDEDDMDALLGMMRGMGAPVDELPEDLVRGVLGGLVDQFLSGEERKDPAQNALVLFFNTEDETDPTYLEWLRQRKVRRPADVVPTPLRTETGQEPRNPNEREVRAMTLALQAANQFVGHHARALQGPLLVDTVLTYEAHVGTGAQRVSVEVTYPPRDYDWDKDAEAARALAAPLPEGAERSLFRLHVQLEDHPEVWRRLELRGDHTLLDLHEAIQDAFGWDDDHLYAFYLSGKAWDQSTEYESPYADGAGRDVSRYALAQLQLRARKKFLYIFDFGDEWRHRITVEAVVRDGAQAGTEYPREVERHGENIPQYPGAEEWDEEEQEELEVFLEEGEDGDGGDEDGGP
jgi:hypothetical protein